MNSLLKITLIGVLTLNLLSTCKNAGLDKKTILLGVFVEKLPTEGRTILDFRSETELYVTYIIDGEQVSTSFTITYLEDTIELSDNQADQTSSFIISYTIIDKDSFEIESLMPDISDEIMIFSRD